MCWRCRRQPCRSRRRPRSPRSRWDPEDPRRPRAPGRRGARRRAAPANVERGTRHMVASARRHGQGLRRTGCSADRPARRILGRKMSRPSAQNRKELRVIARRVMTERGLLPDFSAEATAEADAITKPAADSGPSIRDLSGLLWASIDNDDSRDLDQLSVSEPLAGGAVKILVAVADVEVTVAAGSPIDAHARTN